MKCAKCGIELQEGSQFCSACGLAVESDMPKSEQTPNKRNKRVFILSAVALVAVVIVALVFVGVGTKPMRAAENVLYLELYDYSDTVVGSASGFLINDGKQLVTNYHVIEDSYRIVAVTSDGKKKVEITEVSACDENADLAILNCDYDLGVKALILADSDSVKQGDKIYAAGYPLGLANTLSDGIVSSRYAEDETDIIQITAAISQGSSGGALLNKKGEVIGVVSAYYVDGQNLNIAVASNEVIKLASENTGKISLERLFMKKVPQLQFDKYYACVREIVVPTREKAEQIYNEWQAGEATEDSLIILMDKYGASQGGGQLYFVEPGMWVDEIDAWCFDATRRVGDVAIIENLYGYALCYYSDAIRMGMNVEFENRVVEIENYRERAQIENKLHWIKWNGGTQKEQEELTKKLKALDW